ncbi:hypothetical protein APUTEX25_002482, partial [Auxenochlorella protothecoides]
MDVDGPPEAQGAAAPEAPPLAAGAPAPAPAGAGAAASPDGYLVECVTFASRMLEQLLALNDTAAAFVEAGGCELLLALYRLPRLPPSFGSTNASHSLLVTFRVFATQGPALDRVTGLLRTELVRALEEAVAVASALGPDAVVPGLPPAPRDAYVRALSRAEGLVALAATLVRTGAAFLAGV